MHAIIVSLTPPPTTSQPSFLTLPACCRESLLMMIGPMDWFQQVFWAAPLTGLSDRRGDRQTSKNNYEVKVGQITDHCLRAIWVLHVIQHASGTACRLPDTERITWKQLRRAVTIKQSLKPNHHLSRHLEILIFPSGNGLLCQRSELFFISLLLSVLWALPWICKSVGVPFPMLSLSLSLWLNMSYVY